MPDNSSNNNDRDGVRKSFIGSLKNRFGKRSDGGDGASSPVSPVASSPASASAPSPRARGFATSSAASQSERNPLTNPSGPTRRPVHEPPPPYSEIAELAGSNPTAAPAPAATPARAAPAVGISIRPASPAPSNRSAASSRLTADNIRSAEDPYAFLTMFDTIFVIDDSGSMAGRSWREVQAVLANITPICTQRDADGIDIYFLNHKSTAAPAPGTPGGQRMQQPRAPPGKATGGYYNVQDAATVGRIFQSVKPGGATPTGIRLHNILQPYLRYYDAKRKEMEQQGDYGDPDPEDIKPINIIVVTDGVPTDDLDEILVKAAKKLDALDAPHYQVGVQFFQVGNEPEAAKYLQDLDDNLGAGVAGGLRDMVDTVTWDAFVRRNHGGGGASTALGLTADGILKAVLGAVVKRLDSRPTGANAPANNPSLHRYLSVSQS